MCQSGNLWGKCLIHLPSRGGNVLSIKSASWLPIPALQSKGGRPDLADPRNNRDLKSIGLPRPCSMRPLASAVVYGCEVSTEFLAIQIDRIRRKSSA